MPSITMASCRLNDIDDSAACADVGKDEAAIIAANQIVVYGGVVAVAAGARHWAGPAGAKAAWMLKGVGLMLIAAAALTLWQAWR